LNSFDPYGLVVFSNFPNVFEFIQEAVHNFFVREFVYPRAVFKKDDGWVLFQKFIDDLFLDLQDPFVPYGIHIKIFILETIDVAFVCFVVDVSHGAT